METDERPRQQRAQVPLRATSSASAGGRRIGVLIVAYNAAKTLPGVLDRIPPEVWMNVEEVAVFDDASTDDTVAVARAWQAARPEHPLRVMGTPRNLGYGGNQKQGYRAFAERGFDVVVLLHGDGQYAPELLADLYAPIVAGDADAVLGTRMNRVYGGPMRGGMPLYKYLGNRVLTALTNACLRMRLSEFHSGYRAYSLDALRSLSLDNLTNDFHFDVQIIVKLQHQRFRIREVPIPTHYGDEVCHVNGLLYAWNVARTLLGYRATIGAAGHAPEFAEYRPSHR